MDTHSVWVLIVNYRTPELTLNAMRSVSRERDALPGLRVMIVDGGSGDRSAERLQAEVNDPAFADWVEVLPLAMNGGFGWANNQAMLTLLQRSATPDFFFLLNPDAEIEPGAIAQLFDVLDRDDKVAAVGSLLINDDGSISGSAFRHPSPARELMRGAKIGVIGRLLRIEPTLVTADTAIETDWVTGASVMLRAVALADAGLFDSGFFLYFEEVELMWRLRRAGWKIVHQPASRVRHIGGAATKLAYNKRELRKAPPLPDYWFDSRRRMFALTHGTRSTVVANILWLIGHGIFHLARLLGFKRSEQRNRGEARSLLRMGLWPTSEDKIARPMRPRDALGVPPAWMEQARIASRDIDPHQATNQ